MRVWEGGLVWSGQVCSTWVWLARSSTRRTWELPLGNLLCPCVRAGNAMAARTSFFACFCYARGLDFVVEQPASSLLWRHDALRHVAFRARKLGFTYHQISTFMSQFCAPTSKPTILTGNCSWLHALARDSPGQCDERSGTATVTVDENGRRQVTGDKTGALKETQEYTREFGIAVHDAYPAVIINSDNLDIQHEGNDMCGNMSRAHPTNNEPITKLTNNDCLVSHRPVHVQEPHLPESVRVVG